MSDASSPAACAVFPPRPASAHPVVYAVDVVLVPVVFGLGLFGGLLALLVLHRSLLRKESAVYTYLTGLAVMDLLSLLSQVTKALQDTEVVPPPVTYSRVMAHVTTGSYAVANIAKHAATWLMCLLPLIRYQCSKYRFTKTRWTKISTSRIIVFLVVLFCTLIDFPRFLEVEVTEVKGHCFANMEVWFWRYTDFGRTNLFTVVFPLVVVALCFALPFLLMLIFSLVLLGHLLPPGRRKPHRQQTCLYTPGSADEAEHQSSVTVLVLVLVFSILTLPDAIGQVFVAYHGQEFRNTPGFYEFTVIARLLYLLRCSINFILLSLLSSHFRKAFLRTFCCFCTPDEYYEPITCRTIFCCCCDRIDEDNVPASKSSKSSKHQQANGKHLHKNGKRHHENGKHDHENGKYGYENGKHGHENGKHYYDSEKYSYRNEMDFYNNGNYGNGVHYDRANSRMARGSVDSDHGSGSGWI